MKKAEGMFEIDQLEMLAKSIGFCIKVENRENIATLLSDSRKKVLEKALTLPADAPPALIFDAR